MIVSNIHYDATRRHNYDNAAIPSAKEVDPARAGQAMSRSIDRRHHISLVTESQSAYGVSEKSTLRYVSAADSLTAMQGPALFASKRKTIYDTFYQIHTG